MFAYWGHRASVFLGHATYKWAKAVQAELSGKSAMSQIPSPYRTNSTFRVLKRQGLQCCLCSGVPTTWSFLSGWRPQLGGLGEERARGKDGEKAKADLTWLVSKPDLLWFYRRQSWSLCQTRCRESFSTDIQLPYMAWTISGCMCACAGGLCTGRQPAWGHSKRICARIPMGCTSWSAGRNCMGESVCLHSRAHVWICKKDDCHDSNPFSQITWIFVTCKYLKKNTCLWVAPLAPSCPAGKTGRAGGRGRHGR